MNSDIIKRFNKVKVSRTFLNILEIYNFSNKKVLDIGCGYGEYLKLFGTNSQGITTTDDEVRYGSENNINIVKGNIEEINNMIGLGKFEAIWANNLFEHLSSPHVFLINLKSISTPDTNLILGVPVVPKIVNLMKISKFRGALASNHIGFYTKDTLKLTVKYAGWKVIEIRPFIFKIKILDYLASFFAPHLYIVAKNDASFRYPEKKQKEWRGEKMYSNLFKITENETIN